MNWLWFVRICKKTKNKKTVKINNVLKNESFAVQSDTGLFRALFKTLCVLFDLFIYFYLFCSVHMSRSTVNLHNRGEYIEW